MDNNIKTAWIIDDDEIYKYGFRKFVSMKEYCPNIFDFKNGKEALEYLTDSSKIENLPDIIFLDIDMPVMDGWGFVDEFRKLKGTIDKKITLLMVTSSLNYNDIVRAKCYPEINDYIVKPIDGVQFSAAFSAGLTRISA